MQHSARTRRFGESYDFWCPLELYCTRVAGNLFPLVAATGKMSGRHRMYLPAGTRAGAALFGVVEMNAMVISTLGPDVRLSVVVATMHTQPTAQRVAADTCNLSICVLPCLSIPFAALLKEGHIVNLLLEGRLCWRWPLSLPLSALL